MNLNRAAHFSHMCGHWSHMCGHINVKSATMYMKLRAKMRVVRPVSMTPRAVMPAEACSWDAMGRASAMVTLLGIIAAVKPAYGTPALGSRVYYQARVQLMPTGVVFCFLFFSFLAHHHCVVSSQSMLLKRTALGSRDCHADISGMQNWTNVAYP